MKKLRIGLLNPTTLVRRPIAELAQELSKRGHDVTIITVADDHAAWIPAHFEDRRIRTLSLPSKEIRRVLWALPYPSTFTRLWKAMKQFDVIQIWAPYYIHAVLPLLFGLFMRRRSRLILTFDTFPGYSFTFDSPTDFFMRCYHQTIGRWLFNHSDAITLYSRQLLPFLQRVHIDPARTNIISTGITLPPMVQPRAFGSRLEIIFIGLLNRRKGVDQLLEALAEAQKANIAFHATIIGDGPQRDEYHEKSFRLGISEAVEFIGRTSDVQRYLRAANILVLPSYGEGLPGVVMEAMAFGVPVVATDIPCLTDLIPNANFGQLVPVGDVHALCSAIEAYARNPEYHRMVATNARKHIEAFSWSNVVPKYEALYTQLA